MRRPALIGSALLAGALVAVPTVAVADTPSPTTPVAAAFSASAPAATTPDPATAAAASAPASTTPAAAASAAAPPASAATAALPSNAFAVIGRAKVARDGSITLSVKPQAAGKFLAFATTPAPIGSELAAGASSRPSPQPAPLPLPYGTALTLVPAGDQVPLVFHPGKAGREALVRLKRPTTTKPLRVTIAVSFVPTGGVLNTVVYVVKVAAAQIKTAK